VIVFFKIIGFNMFFFVLLLWAALSTFCSTEVKSLILLGLSTYHSLGLEELSNLWLTLPRLLLSHLPSIRLRCRFALPQEFRKQFRPPKDSLDDVACVSFRCQSSQFCEESRNRRDGNFNLKIYGVGGAFPHHNWL